MYVGLVLSYYISFVNRREYARIYSQLQGRPEFKESYVGGGNLGRSTTHTKNVPLRKSLQ